MRLRRKKKKRRIEGGDRSTGLRLNPHELQLAKETQYLYNRWVIVLLGDLEMATCGCQNCTSVASTNWKPKANFRNLLFPPIVQSTSSKPRRNFKGGFHLNGDFIQSYTLGILLVCWKIYPLY